MEFHPGHAWVTQRTMQSPPLNPSSELLTSFMQTCGGCFFGHFYVCLFSYYNWKLEAGAQNVPSWWDQYCAFQGLFICGHFFWIVRLDDVLIFFFFLFQNLCHIQPSSLDLIVSIFLPTSIKHTLEVRSSHILPLCCAAFQARWLWRLGKSNIYSSTSSVKKWSW